MKPAVGGHRASLARCAIQSEVISDLLRKGVNMRGPGALYRRPVGSPQACAPRQSTVTSVGMTRSQRDVPAAARNASAAVHGHALAQHLA